MTHPGAADVWQTNDHAGRADGAHLADRRRVLRGVGTAGGIAIAGCLGRSGSTPTGRERATAGPDLPPPVLGDPEANVTVGVYEDFSCPHCASFNREVFPRIETEYLEPETVRYEHHDFPIPVDDWSWPAASAARAVQDGRGDRPFFAYAKRLFENQGQFTLARLAELAEAVGADGPTAREAADEERYRPVVEADRSAGLDRGVSGTPTVFVDDERMVAPSFAELADAIDGAR